MTSTMRLKTMAALLTTGTLFAAGIAQAASVQVYSNNFESAASVGSGVNATITGQGASVGSEGYSAYGFGTKLFRNSAAAGQATRLTLSGLETHTSISLGFLLAVIDSWDGTGGCGPDIFNVNLNGISIFANNFGNVRDGSCGAHPQSYGTANALFFPTASNIDNTLSSTNVGFNSRWNDSAYDMTRETLFQNIAHTGATATFDFFASGAGWQAGWDESWGIDNVTVTLNGVARSNNVPEPGGLALLGLGLAGIGFARGKKRKANF